METIEIISDDLKKGLILLKSVLRASTKGVLNFREITNTLTIIDKLITKIENLKDTDEEDYGVEIILDE